LVTLNGENKKADDCHTDEKPHKLDEVSHKTITINMCSDV